MSDQLQAAGQSCPHLGVCAGRTCVRKQTRGTEDRGGKEQLGRGWGGTETGLMVQQVLLTPEAPSGSTRGGGSTAGTRLLHPQTVWPRAGCMASLCLSFPDAAAALLDSPHERALSQDNTPTLQANGGPGDSAELVLWAPSSPQKRSSAGTLRWDHRPTGHRINLGASLLACGEAALGPASLLPLGVRLWPYDDTHRSLPTKEEEITCFRFSTSCPHS